MAFESSKSYNVTWYGAEPLRALVRPIEYGQTRIVPGSKLTDQLIADYGATMVISDVDTGAVLYSGGEIDEALRRATRALTQSSYKILTWWGREPFRELGRTWVYGQSRVVPPQVITSRLLDRVGDYVVVQDQASGAFDWIGRLTPNNRTPRSITQQAYKILTWWGRDPFRDLGRTWVYGQSRTVPARVVTAGLLNRRGANITIQDQATGVYEWRGSNTPKIRTSRSASLAFD